MILINSLTLIFFKKLFLKNALKYFKFYFWNARIDCFFFFPQKNSHLSYCHILGIASYKAADNSFISVLV